MECKMKKVGLGTLKLPLWFSRYVTVTGGPYMESPKTYYGVKLAEEIRAPYRVSIPTKDFSVPKKADLDEGLANAVRALLHGERVYVGCMGGRGRTGLFLAILAKAFGIKNPVEYVRKNYFSHAVETKEQYVFVTNYKVPFEVQLDISLSKCMSFMRPQDVTFGKAAYKLWA